MTTSAVCASCGFENPLAWRACARCGEPLTSAPPRTGIDQTLVTDEPSFDSGDEDLDAPTIPGRGGPGPTAAAPTGPEDGPETTAEADEVEPPLIGQAEAAEAVRTGVERAFTVGSPTLVALLGGPGSGKTRLLTYASEIAARVADDVRVLYAACRGGGSDGPYAPISRLLLERFGVTPSSAPSTVRGQMATTVSDALMTKDAITVAETTHLLGHVAGVPFPDSPFLSPLENRPDELLRRAALAVRRLIEGDAQRRPVLVLLDDMQHAHDDAWRVIEELAKASAHIAIVIAGGEGLEARVESIMPQGGVAIGPIAPLVEADVASMLHVLMPSLVQAPEPLVAAITHRSRGNPGAVRELAYELLESDLFEQTEDGLVVDLEKLQAGDLPVTLEDAIESRLSRLNEFDRATLERASVVGKVFWDGAILAQMRSEREPLGADDDPRSIWPDDDDLDALNQALGRLEERGFASRVEVTELPGAREFTFDLAGVRELVHARASGDLVAQRHAAVARWLSVTAELRREGVAALIAPHLEMAGMKERAGRAFLEAAGHERRKLNTAAALRYVDRALPLIPADDVVRRIEALHERGSLLTTIGQYDDALDAFVEMLRLAWKIGARGKGGAAMNRLARVHRQRGEDEAAALLLGRALELFRRAGDLRGVASTLDDLAQIHRLRSENEAAARAAGEALEIRQAHGDQRGEAVSLTTLGGIELSRGALDVAERFFEQALHIRQAISDREGTMQSHNALGIVAFERGDRETSVSSWRAALASAREMADRRAQCFLLNNIGEALLADGKSQEAMTTLEDAREHAQSLGDKRGMAEVARNLGLASLKLGAEDAEERMENALHLAKDYGGPELIALAHRAIGQFRSQTLFDASGEVDRRAEESFLMSIDLFREAGSEKEAARSLAELGYHLIERGDVETARERLREARAIMRGMGLAELDRVDRTLSEID